MTARSKDSRIARSRRTACSITPKLRQVRTTAIICSSDFWNRWNMQPSGAEVAKLWPECHCLQPRTGVRLSKRALLASQHWEILNRKQRFVSAVPLGVLQAVVHRPKGLARLAGEQ